MAHINQSEELLKSLQANDFEAFIVYDFKQRILPNGEVTPPVVNEPYSMLVAFRKMQVNHPGVGPMTREKAKLWLLERRFSTALE